MSCRQLAAQLRRSVEVLESGFHAEGARAKQVYSLTGYVALRHASLEDQQIVANRYMYRRYCQVAGVAAPP